MIINIKDWRMFLVEDIFLCETTRAINEKALNAGNIPYITRSAFNNGCSNYIEHENKTNEPNCITIGAEGRFAFYQPKEFYTGIKVYTLRNKYLNKYNALFICSILNFNVCLYQYNEARILEKIKKEKIYLPVNTDNEPDWEYMENYMRDIETKAKAKINILKGITERERERERELNKH